MKTTLKIFSCIKEYFFLYSIVTLATEQAKMFIFVWETAVRCKFIQDQHQKDFGDTMGRFLRVCLQKVFFL